MKIRILAACFVAVVGLAGLVTSTAAEKDRGKDEHRMRNQRMKRNCPCMMANTEEGRKHLTEMGVEEPMIDRCQMMMQMKFNPKDPAALMAMEKHLGLSAEQMDKLKGIADKSRSDAEAVLTEDQKKKVESMADTPDTMIKMHEEMRPMMKKMDKGEKWEEED